MPQRESSLAPGERHRGAAASSAQGSTNTAAVEHVAQEHVVPTTPAEAARIPIFYRAAALAPIGFLSLIMLFGCDTGSTFGRGLVGDLTHCVGTMPIAVPVCIGLSAAAFLGLSAFAAAAGSGRFLPAIRSLVHRVGAQLSLASLAVCCGALAVLGEGGEVPAAVLAAVAVAAIIAGIVKGIQSSTAVLPATGGAASAVAPSPVKAAAAAAAAGASPKPSNHGAGAAGAGAAGAAAVADAEESESDSEAEEAPFPSPFDAYLAAYGRQLARIIARMAASGSLWAHSEEDVTEELAAWLAAHPLSRPQVQDAKARGINRDEAFEGVWNDKMAAFDDMLAEAREEEAGGTVSAAIASRRLALGNSSSAATVAMPMSTPALTAHFRCKAAAAETSVGVVTHTDGSIAYAGRVALDAAGRLRPHGLGAFYPPRACTMATLAAVHPSIVGSWSNGAPEAGREFKVFLVRHAAHGSGADIGYSVATAKFTGNGGLASLEVQKEDALESGPLDSNITLPWRL